MVANSPAAAQRCMGPRCIIKEGQQWDGKVKHGLLGTVYLNPEHVIRPLSSAKLQPQWRLLNKTEDLCWRFFSQLLKKDSCPSLRLDATSIPKRWVNLPGTITRTKPKAELALAQRLSP